MCVEGQKTSKASVNKRTNGKASSNKREVVQCTHVIIVDHFSCFSSMAMVTVFSLKVFQPIFPRC